MVKQIQKADWWKRIAAFLLDMILAVVASTGFALAISAISGYDGYAEKWDAAMSEYGERYGVDFNIEADAYEKLSDEEKAVYNEAYAALRADESAIKNFNIANSLILVITSVGILLGMIVTELVVPMIFKNGVTIGKQVFGLCVVGNDGIRIKTINLIIRTLLGKYAVETMVPVMLAISFFFGTMGILSPIVILAFFVIQLVLIGATENKTPLHDIISYTMVVDAGSTMIFDSPEAKIEYESKAAEDTQNDY